MELMRVELTIHRSLRRFLGRSVNEDTQPLDLAEGTTPQEVLDDLGFRKGKRWILLFVNRRMVDPDLALKEGDHLMLYPPLCGG